MANRLESDYPNYPHYPRRARSSDELTRRRSRASTENGPPFSPFGRQSTLATVATFGDESRRFTANAGTGPMRNRQQRPGMEYKGLFNRTAVFHSYRVRGQWFGLLNKIACVFNKCSTRKSPRNNMSKTAILGRYMWSLNDEDASGIKQMTTGSNWERKWQCGTL